MIKISGYVREMAHTLVKQQLNKPFLGKPYLKRGQCQTLWAYFFQLGGILGAKHCANVDALGHAFLNVTGEPGATKRFFTEVANQLVAPFVNDSMTFGDYVGAEFTRRAGYTGEPARYFLEHGMDKTTPETAAELSCQYSFQGAALGAIYPQMVRRMFAWTHAQVPTEKWELARAAGLNIAAEQQRMSYEEIEESENEVFMAFCRECCPSLYSILTG
jgi:hypothetical protein